MELRQLGRSGLKVSRLGLGCMTFGSPSWRPWVLDQEAAKPLIREAIELGINFFDTADVYSHGRSEEIVGEVLGEHARRDEIVIATKLFFPVAPSRTSGGLSRKHIFNAVDASLKRLRTDHIDLYQVHRWDPHTLIDETIDALDDVIKSGRVRYVGASSMFAWQLAKALFSAEMRGRSRFVSMQNHYNLAYREEEREMLPLCRDQGLGVLPWSPLGRGFLAGGHKGDSGAPSLRAGSDDLMQRWYGAPSDLSIRASLEEVAVLVERKPAEVAISWLASRPGVTAPIVSASRPGQLRELTGALDLVLEDAQVAALESQYQPREAARW